MSECGEGRAKNSLVSYNTQHLAAAAAAAAASLNE
jgi:hypothetical protein